MSSALQAIASTSGHSLSPRRRSLATKQEKKEGSNIELIRTFTEHLKHRIYTYTDYIKGY